MIEITQVDHIGIRVTDAQRAIDFYKLLGFEVFSQVEYDDVIIIKNKHGVEINLITNGDDANENKNILMDVDKKYPGYTHVALRVDSIQDAIERLEQRSIRISQGPVTFGDGHVSVFIRDPDRNVIELRGRDQDMTGLGGVTFYEPAHKHLR
ncbi:MAG: VOC family protein [Gammaproteobacteria bacterium]